MCSACNAVENIICLAGDFAMAIRPNSPQAKDIAYHLHPYTNAEVHEEIGPRIITGGDGVYVIDNDGNRYIEGLAGLWCTSLRLQRKAPRRRRHDVLFVADEVICGFSRTGNMFGCETYDIKPDMMTVAKALSSAYLPIAGAMISDEIYQAIKAESDRLGLFGTGYTYSGHPVPAAVALETLKIYEERDILGHVRGIMPHFLERLHGFADHPLIGETRGVGLIGAVQMVPDKSKNEVFDPALKVGPAAAKYCAAHRLIIRPLPGDAIAFCPPLIITKDQIDDMFDSLAGALDDTLDDLTRQGAMAA